MPIPINDEDGVIWQLSATAEGALEINRVGPGSAPGCRLNPSDGSKEHTFSVGVDNGTLATAQLEYDASAPLSRDLGSGWSLIVTWDGYLGTSRK